MTAIVSLDLSNTTFDMIQAVNVLALDHNKLTEASGVLRANGTLILSGNGTTLIVNNAATFATVNANTIQATTIIGTNVVVRGVDVLSHANNAYAQANTGNNAANTANFRAIGAFAQANSAFTEANAATSGASGAFAQANAAWATANIANTVSGANGDFLFSNNGLKFTTSKVNLNLTTNTLTLSCNLSTGDITSTGNVTSSSDRALKANIAPIVSAKNTIIKLEGKQYNLLNSPVTSYGFIAQEVEKILPDLVFGREGKKSLAYLNIIAFCVEAIKELDVEVQELKKSVEDLKNGRQ